MQNAATVLDVIRLALECAGSGVITGERRDGKLSRGVRREADGKGPRLGHLASGLPDSTGRGWKRTRPTTAE